MNIEKSKGESSSREQENGDGPTGSERPLKKARFAWQVKGKYHLKNDSSDSVKSAPPTATDTDQAGSSGSSNTNTIGTEKNLEILGDYLLKQDFNALDSVITDPDKSLLKPSNSISDEKLQYPRYVSSHNNVSNSVHRRSIDSDNNMTSSVFCNSASMVISENYTEDHCIAQWQARQLAKGFVDNTINHVLDSWIQVPLPPEENGSRFIALDVADFINNLPGDNSIENEGILMAISAHGLQNTSNSSGNEDTVTLNTNFPSSPQRSLSPVPSDDESHETNNNQCDTDTSSNELDTSWSYSEEQRNENDSTAFPLFPDSSSLTYPYFNNNQTSSNVDCNQGEVRDNHCDFLDAAVLFAIQSKGLTTFGTDYG